MFLSKLNTIPCKTSHNHRQTDRIASAVLVFARVDEVLQFVDQVLDALALRVGVGHFRLDLNLRVGQPPSNLLHKLDVGSVSLEPASNMYPGRRFTDAANPRPLFREKIHPLLPQEKRPDWGLTALSAQ